jgi:hypothetical protein
MPICSFDITNALSVKEKTVILNRKEIPALNCEDSHITACSPISCCVYITTRSSCEVNRLETDDLLTKHESGRTNKLPGTELMLTLNETRRMTQGLNSKGMKFHPSAQGFVLLWVIEKSVYLAESPSRTLQL